MPRRWFSSLRGKLLLFSLALVAVPGVVFAVIAIAGARRALESAVGRQLAEVAHDTAAQLTELLAREQRNVATWARQDLMREVLINDLDKRIARLLTSLQAADTGYLDILCTDAGGHVVAATDPARLGQTHRDAAWYRAVIGGREYLDGPMPLAEYPTPVLQIAAPIYNPDSSGTVIGSILGLYDWRRGSALAERIRQSSAALGFAVDVLILDSDGVVIIEAARSDLAQRLGVNLRSSGWAAAQRNRPNLRPRFVREVRADALVGFAPLRGLRPTWTAIILQPLQQALAPVDRLQRRLLILLAGVLLAGIGVAVLLAERMSRPLRELTEATQEIARVGETRQPVPVRSRDEIGQLAGAFNTMTQQLRRAKDDLVVAARFALVGEVAAGVAHEVRTPLSILRSSAQLLGRSLPPGQAEHTELVEMIVAEADRLDRVVAELLELARPRQPLLERMPLEPLITRALDFVNGRARERKIRIERAFTADPRAARCDPEQMYQVALNLVVNALQILPPGGVISVRTLPARNGYVAFEVSDNGPGIPAELQERIFTPFFTMREGGTGLGLALVQRIVQAHHGTVSVDSAVGRGTTFRIELPVAEQA